MALTPFRWIAGLIIGCLVASMVVLRGSDRVAATDLEYLVRSRVERSVARLEDHASTAARRLHLLQVIDSARSSIARADATPAIRVFRDAKLSPATVPEIDWLVNRATRQVRDSGHVPLDLIFVYDTLSRLRGTGIWRGSLTASYVLPVQPNDRCTVIVRASFRAANPSQGARSIRNGAITYFRSEATADQLLGPCAYYRAFGMPGVSVDRWLHEHALSFAAEAGWDRELPPLFLDPRAWRYYYANVGYYNNDFPGSSPDGPTDRVTPLLYMSTVGAHCALGDVTACEYAVMVPDRGARGPTWNGNVTSATLGPDVVGGFTALGPREPLLLAEMVRSLGRDRFSRFWTSTEPVPAAFEKAAGESLGAWTARWANATYEPGSPGPRIGMWGMVFSVLIIALGILVALQASERRQFQ